MVHLRVIHHVALLLAILVLRAAVHLAVFTVLAVHASCWWGAGCCWAGASCAMAANGKVNAEMAVRVRSFFIAFSIATLRTISEGSVIAAENGAPCLAEGNHLIGLRAVAHFHARRSEWHAGHRETSDAFRTLGQ